MKETIYCLVLITIIIYVKSAPLKNATLYSKIPSTMALDFMKKYGYIESDDDQSAALYTENGVSELLKKVQMFGAIPQTGILDNDTLKLMMSPRCGNPDILRKKRQKRYNIDGRRWNKRQITYFISNQHQNLNKNKVAKNIQLALDTWGKYGNLRFTRSDSSKADIIVTFARGSHGDDFPFDGPGQILAHAFLPNPGSEISGDIHFDSDEDWTERRRSEDDTGTDFLAVALHELGHSLGLSHSTAPNSVMFPYYGEFDPNAELKLGYDDILAMYELYIRRPIEDNNYDSYPEHYTEKPVRTTQRPITRRTTTYRTYRPWTYQTTQRPITRRTTTHRTYRPRTYQTTQRHFVTRPTSTPRWPPTISYEGDSETVEVHKEHDRTGISTTPTPPDICHGKVDAVATLRNELFIFKDQHIWRLREKGHVMQGYPITLYHMFPTLPASIEKIDAAYERNDGAIILFTGNMYWVYDGNRFTENSPRPIGDYGLPNELDSIDAVQTWDQNKKTYFYKDSKFWRYNETAKAMDPGYPKHIERWRGVPHRIDAATTWKDGITYFFKDELFWKFDNQWQTTADQYPLPIGPIWLGCAEDELNMRRFN